MLTSRLGHVVVSDSRSLGFPVSFDDGFEREWTIRRGIYCTAYFYSETLDGEFFIPIVCMSQQRKVLKDIVAKLTRQQKQARCLEKHRI